MKHFLVLAMFVALTAPAFAKTPKQYEVGQVSAYHYTTTATTVACSGSASVACSSYDTSRDHALYSITLADGSTHVVEHVGFGTDPLKTLVSAEATPVKYRIKHKRGIVSVDFVQVLAAKGKEGSYSFAYHDGLKRPVAKNPVGPAPVTP